MSEEDYLKEEAKNKEDDDNHYHRQLEEEEAKTEKLTYEDHWDAFWNNDKSK